MKAILIICLVIIASSCKGNYNLYISNSKYGEDIFGYEMQRFFKRKDIKRIKFSDKYLLEKEILEIKRLLIESNALPLNGENFGMYKYAFVISEDTIYSDSSLNGWRYKNKVIRYDNINPILKKEILQL